MLYNIGLFFYKMYARKSVNVFIDEEVAVYNFLSNRM